MTRLAQSILTYAVSATANATSAGLFAIAAELRVSGSALQGSVGIAGSLFLYLGLLAGLASAILFLDGFEKIGEASRWAAPDFRKALSIFRTLSILGFTALLLLAGIYAGAFVSFSMERAQFFVVGFQGVSAVAAAIFVVALGSVPFHLPMVSPRRLAVAACLLAGIGITVELIIGVANSAPFAENSSSLLTFGGFPLINVNLPFGATVALSAALMWMAYRRVSIRYGEWPAPIRGIPMGPGTL